MSRINGKKTHTHNLGNAARHVGKHLADAVERKKTSIGARSPLPTPSFLSLRRHVATLVQTCMPSSRSSPSDGYSTGRRHTPMSPNIWRRDRSSTSSAAILFCFAAGTLIPHASPSLHRGWRLRAPDGPIRKARRRYKRIVPGG